TAMGAFFLFGGVDDDLLRLLLGVGSIVDYLMLAAVLIFASRIYKWSPNHGFSSDAIQPADPRKDVAKTEPEAILQKAAIAIVVAGAVALALALWLQLSGSNDPGRVGNAFFAANSFGALAILLRSSRLMAVDVRGRFFAGDVLNTVLFWTAAVIAAAAIFPRIWTAVPNWLGGKIEPWDGDYWLAALIASFLALVVSVVARHLAQGSLYSGRFFSPPEMRHLETFAEVLIEGPREVVSPEAVARGADNYLAMVKSSRRLAARVGFLAATEVFPYFRFRLPMSRMGYLECREYLEKSFRNGKGIWRSVIRTRQMVLMAYYATAEVKPEIGFEMFPDRQRYLDLEAKGENLTPGTGPKQYLPVSRERFHHCKVCVIGSGAGGAVAAAALAEKFGKDVTILEAGPYVQAHEFTHYEPEASATLYKDGGLNLSQDLQMVLLQGYCVGGSTVHNNAICFDLPDSVLRNWAAAGAPLNEAEIRAAQAKLRARLNIHRLEDHLLPKGSVLFEQGVSNLVLRGDQRIEGAERFDVNFEECIGCGFCTTGCRYGRKLSMLESYIPEAMDHGARLIPDCEALSFDIKDGKAVGLKCRIEGKYDFYVKADHFVVACGTIASSLLLERSHVKGPVGEQMSFNLATTVSAEFPELVNGFDGVQMCSYARCEGYMLETLFNPPSSYALTMPGWFLDHFKNMQRYAYLANGGVMVPSPSMGRLRRPLWVGKFLPNFDYPLAEDAKSMGLLMQGMKLLCEVYLEAGATRVLPSTYADIVIRTKADLPLIDAAVKKPEDILIASAHPQGGNAINTDPSKGVVDTDLRVHGVSNVVVCDASVFPTGVEVNPQLSVMTVALYGAERLASRIAGAPVAI
ncbi:MAG TPA: GMC family oxidoreductase N-terminal domain-containing protein, partial [Dehalococcoidia bacterium]|nr:GMC family oxidoreductase N-terminal domain-containing protein [Dehalococcoidia bacterium]